MKEMSSSHMALVKSSPDLASGHSLLAAYMGWRWQVLPLCRNAEVNELGH